MIEIVILTIRLHVVLGWFDIFFVVRFFDMLVNHIPSQCRTYILHLANVFVTFFYIQNLFILFKIASVCDDSRLIKVKQC